jgi:collagenase-like PrtC family protease
MKILKKIEVKPKLPVRTLSFKVKNNEKGTKETKLGLLNSQPYLFKNNVKERKIELLAPAGSMATLKAAVASGADAVYLGMSKFNARTSAKNFDRTNFKEAVRICKSNNVKLYLTANTLIKNSEISEFLEEIKYAYEEGIDAVIIQDPSFIPIIQKSFPELKIHISTQTGVMNSNQANLFSDNENVESVNIARELTKENIEILRKKFSKQIEIFVHGALCACVSGSCLFSSFLGGRSGNRGKCAQPCRKIYNGVYMLSTKELSLIEKVPEAVRLGVNSLKIEGRMRTPYYVATTVSNYRKAIDSYYAGQFKITNEMKEELRSAFSREFTEGKFSDQFIFNLKQASGSFSTTNKIYDVETRIVNLKKRKSNPLSIPNTERKSAGKKIVTRIYSQEQARIAENYSDILCLDIFHEDFKEIQKETKKPLYAYTPRIMFDSDLELIKEKIKELSPSGILAGNSGIINLNLGLPIILDYNDNCFNDLQVKYYHDKNSQPMLSPELSLTEMENFKNKDALVFVHGKVRLMTLAHNIQEKVIHDQRGFGFHIKKIFNGVEILNDKELSFFNKIRGLVKAGINQIYIDTEKLDNYEDILKAYRLILEGKTPDTSGLQKNYVLGWSKAGVL